MAVLLIPRVIINYLLLLRKDAYLVHFKKFDKEPARKKQKWAWMTLGVVAGPILLLLLSIEIVPKKTIG
jgi:hypothetical protein